MKIVRDFPLTLCYCHPRASLPMIMPTPGVSVFVLVVPSGAMLHRLHFFPLDTAPDCHWGDFFGNGDGPCCHLFQRSNHDVDGLLLRRRQSDVCLVLT